MGHFSDIKTQEISLTENNDYIWKKQFNIKLLCKKTGTKKFSSFRKSQNHLKNLLGLSSSEASVSFVICQLNCPATFFFLFEFGVPKSHKIAVYFL